MRGHSCVIFDSCGAQIPNLNCGNFSFVSLKLLMKFVAILDIVLDRFCRMVVLGAQNSPAHSRLIWENLCPNVANLYVSVLRSADLCHESAMERSVLAENRW